MKSNFKKNGLLTVLGCLMFSIAIMFGAMFSGNLFVAFASETDGALAPTIVSVAGGVPDGGYAPVPKAIVGEEYKKSPTENYRVIATGSGTLTYSVTTAVGYSLPDGLSLDSSSGVISGTPTTAGTYGFTIFVSNEYGSAKVGCSMSVYNATDKPTITTESLPSGAVGSAYFQTIGFSGLDTTYTTCEVVSGNLPEGLKCKMENWKPTVYGTPTTAGTYTFTVSIYNGVGTATKEYTIEIKEETVKPKLINSATIVNESDKYSFIGSYGSINVIKGKPVNIQLVASGTNTTDNPIKYSLGNDLPDGLTLSEDGLLTGTPADTIEMTSWNKYYSSREIILENTSALGVKQSTTAYVDVIVWKNGTIYDISISPTSTSVAKGGTRQFELDWTGYGDYEETGVTWYVWYKESSSTTITQNGLLTVGLDETATTLNVRAEHTTGRIADATVTIVDHTHTTELVAKVDKTCETDGCDKHYKCTVCDAVFEDALATQSTTLETLKIAKGHEYGELITEVPATCSSTGKKAHYKCSVCEKLFTSEKVETTETDLEIAIVPTAHEFGDWQNEIPANCATEGTKAHKTCEYCHKNFDNDGVEIADLTIARNEEHLKQTEWSKDSTGHWHACTRSGCKDGGKLDYAEHTPSATEPTETTDVHCTVCEYVIEAVKDHTHNLELVAGHLNTCYADGAKTYYVCSKGDNPCWGYFEDETGLNKITENIETWKRIPASHTFGEWITATEATCASTGELAHYTCSVCHYHFDAEGNKIDNIVLEKNDNHIIPDSSTWVNDNYGHWHTCTREGCKNNGKVDYATHTFGDWQDEVPATVDEFGTKAHKDCSVCHDHFDADGNKIDDLTIPKLTPTEPTDPTDPTDPTEPTKPSEEKDNSLSGGAIAGIVVGSVAVAGIGGFALVWFVIKKKKWADLVAIFKKLFKKN